MAEASRKTHDDFLSYSTKDKTWADAACAVLERHRIRCWIARDITPGDEWGAGIIKGLNGSRVMVLIFSGHANASEQVRREVERAISRGMTVLPVRVEDVRPADAMEYALGNRHWLDAFTPPVEKHLERIAQSVKTLLGQHAEPEPPGTGDGPASATETRQPSRFRLIAVAGSLLSLVAVGAILIMIRTMNGEPNTPVPDNPSPKAGRDLGIAQRKRAGGTVRSSIKAQEHSGEAAQQGWVSLFNGKDLTGWKTHPRQPGNWRVENGILIGSGQHASYIYSERADYKDFQLLVEARINNGGNSGALFRSQFGPGWPANSPASVPLGYEAQINATHRDPNKTGSLYATGHGALVALRESPVPPLHWFTLEVSVQGGHIVVKVNRKTTTDYTDEKQLFSSGHIALQQMESSVAEFRQIEIKELGK